MKKILLTLLFTLSLPVLANSETPIGLYRVDSSHSIVSLVDFQVDQELAGLVDIRQELGDSKIKLESPDISFESTKIVGTLEGFEVTGRLNIRGDIKTVVLLGNYIGSVKNLYNEQKIAIRLTRGSLKFRVFAGRPAQGTAELHKVVQDIVQ